MQLKAVVGLYFILVDYLKMQTGSSTLGRLFLKLALCSRCCSLSHHRSHYYYRAHHPRHSDYYWSLGLMDLDFLTSVSSVFYRLSLQIESWLLCLGLELGPFEQGLLLQVPLWDFFCYWTSSFLTLRPKCRGQTPRSRQISWVVALWGTLWLSYGLVSLKFVSRPT